jgi:hypothetical protein
MKTYPYQDGDRLIQLVEKRELDQLLERLAEARESHLAASARDVQTIQRQSVMLERLAGALKAIAWIREIGHRDYSWTGDTAFAALSAYESANLEPCKTCGGTKMTSGWYPTYADPDNAGMHPEAEPCPDCQPVANPIDDVVRRMEAVPVSHLRNLHTNSRTISDGVEAVRTRLIKAAKGEQP